MLSAAELSYLWERVMGKITVRKENFLDKILVIYQGNMEKSQSYPTYNIFTAESDDFENSRGKYGNSQLIIFHILIKSASDDFENIMAKVIMNIFSINDFTIIE